MNLTLLMANIEDNQTHTLTMATFILLLCNWFNILELFYGPYY